MEFHEEFSESKIVKALTCLILVACIALAIVYSLDGIRSRRLGIIKQETAIKIQKRTLEAMNLQIFLIERQMTFMKNVTFEVTLNKRNLAMISAGLRSREKTLNLYADYIRTVLKKSRKKLLRKPKRKRRKK